MKEKKACTVKNTQTVTVVEWLQGDFMNSSFFCRLWSHNEACSGYQFVSSAETLGFAVILCAATNCTSQNMILSCRILGFIFYSSGNTKEILGMHKANCTVMSNIPEIWTVLKHPSCSLQISQLGWKHFSLLHFYNVCVCYKLAMCKICNWLSETLWGRTQVNSSWRVQNS